MVIAACFFPSASVTSARRLRSADIWRVIASWTSLGGVISRISTVVTLTPHRSVTSSSLARRTWLIWSRLARTSSRMMSPITARSPTPHDRRPLRLHRNPPLPALLPSEPASWARRGRPPDRRDPADPRRRVYSFQASQRGYRNVPRREPAQSESLERPRNDR